MMRGVGSGSVGTGILVVRPLEVVHRACDHDLVAVPMDEVA